MSQQQIGVVGMAVMGRNLALNIESRGYSVSIYNRSREKTDEVVAENPGKQLVATYTAQEFVNSLEKPRRILLMVKAGEATDKTIAELTPFLDKGDILIDGGNTYYKDTIRRNRELSEQGFNFIGTGVSGGEEGALKGPSIMPGGQREAYELVAPILEKIAARADGEPCVAYIGADGAGHYVKMVHNGIEYGDMQLICEAYSLFKAAGFTTDEMAAIFNEWNDGELQSYLIQITAKALEQKDPETGKPIVDVILDKAGQKGTGQWTLINAAENAVVISTINAAVEARVLSSQKKARVGASKLLQGPKVELSLEKKALVAKVHDALYASKVISYTQGFDLIKTMGDKKEWGLDLGRIAAIWRGGCIIRARFLNRITDAFRTDPALANLMLDPFFKDLLNRTQQNWREVVALAVSNGIPVPAFSASLAYYDSYRTERLSANLLQAQRDFFGAHTYERVDKPEGQFFHTEWPEVIG